MRKILKKLPLKNIMAAGNDGPPDLDELITDLRKKVDNMFKTKSNNNNHLDIFFGHPSGRGLYYTYQYCLKYLQDPLSTSHPGEYYLDHCYNHRSLWPSL